MIKLLSLFSGIGAFEKALTRQNIPFEIVNYCEIDKYASKSYSVLHNVSEDLNLKDVTKVDTSLLKDKGINLITYGFPCVTKGYLIQTDQGLKPIEEIQENELVLTHNNRYRKVLKTMSRFSNHINYIQGVGCKLELTDEHPLYIYRDNTFIWVKAKDLNIETDCLVYNINQETKRQNISDNILWLIGRYFADGYKENHSLHRVIFCIGKNKVEEFKEHTKGIKFALAHTERECVEFKLLDNNFKWFNDLKSGALLKEIPQWIIDLPKEQLIHFFNGYFSGDGHSRKDRNLLMISTVSKKLCLGIMQIIIKLYNVVPSLSIRVDNRKSTFNNLYSLQFCNNPKNQIIVKNQICVGLKKVERIIKDIEVFNIEVEEDNSYTVNNVIVHNCQDISTAGKQKGLFDENGKPTRSGLFFEALRIINDLKPNICIAENVKALCSKKFKDQFELIINSLNEIGYNSYYDILNAKNFNIPQNRERVFIVSIRKDKDNGLFKFPIGGGQRLLREFLELNPDKSYFLTDVIRDFFIKNSLEQEKKGNGFRFTVTNGNSIAKTITTRAGGRMDDNFICLNIPFSPFVFNKSTKIYFEGL